MHTFLYILAWRPGEDYADITLLSISFLREVHPDGHILLLTDQETGKALDDASHALLSLSDKVIVSEVPLADSSVRSWYLKSRMRRLVQGDFVFLDADTIIRERIDEVFQITAPIAMAENHSRRYPENFPDMERVVYEKNGWPAPGNGHFFNSGVIFWREDPEAYRLSQLWEQFWDLSVSNGCGYDQPALNFAIEKSGVSFQVLDDRYNAQIRANPAAGVDAAVWHFYQTDRRWFPDDWFSLGKKRIRNGEEIDAQFLRLVIASRTPYPIEESRSVSDMITYLGSGEPLDTENYERLSGNQQPSIENATVCTIITANYLPYALALLESVRSFEKDVHFNVLISDKDRQSFNQQISDRHSFFHFADEVCNTGIGEQIRNKYQSSDHDAFRWSCKPLFINHLIRQHGYERVLYFDCDIFIFNAFRFLFDALKKHQVLLTPHWRSSEPDADPEEYRFLFNHGLYNAGFVGSNRDGTEAMDWWARCCLHSCARGSFEGEFVDQSILNLMPVYFEGAHVLRHKGCNVAIWNRNECKRVMQDDGSVMIDNVYPVVFIHFSAGIPRSWDPVLGTYMDRYLATIKSYSEEMWMREINKRNPARDTYLEQKSNLYRFLKKYFVKIRLSVLPPSSQGNIAILGQSGTSQQCLGLWLRQTPGTVLSSIPVSDWAGEGIDELDEKIHRKKQPGGSGRTIDQLLYAAMEGREGNPVHTNWAKWSSIISVRRMVMNFPEGMLCWPELAETLAARHRVIALVSQPLPFAKRMMAIYGDGRSLYCMEGTRTWMQQNPVRPIGLGDLSVAEYAWIIKWCLDMKALESNAANGNKLLIVREEDLMSDTNTALINIFKTIGWQWPGDISAHFNVYCQFQKKTIETVSSDKIRSVDEEKMALNQLMHSFNIKTYAFDLHALMTINPTEQRNKAQ
jgi:lipopolysaccharide biosynthesis glycosyltransferase